jgi:hypothetical protein
MIARSASPLTIGALGVVTIGAYGACYYAFGVLVTPIHTDTGWSLAQLAAVFSVGLVVNGAVGIVGGRDRHHRQLQRGPRRHRGLLHRIRRNPAQVA